VEWRRVGGKTKKKQAKDTRANILHAARLAFARHSYNAASIRMIAAQGGFGHAIIGYYFPTKAELFAAVAADICAELYGASVQWMRRARRLPPAEGLAAYIRRLVDFGREKPWVFQIIMLNFAENRDAILPGQEHLLETIEKIRNDFVVAMGLELRRDEARRFTDSFNAMALYFLGSRESAAWLLGMNPAGGRYAQWVQDTMLALFLPAMNQLLERGGPPREQPAQK